MKKKLSWLLLVFLFAYPAFSQPTLNLMPVPAKLELQEGKLRLEKSFSLNISGDPHARIYGAANRFMRRLDSRSGMFFRQGIITPESVEKEGVLQITVNTPGQVKLGEDESYQLRIDANGISIDAETDIGALYGLETLLQLLDADEEGYFFPHIEIDDQPRFGWRGLMIDVARHWQPIEKLKQNLDGMAAVKMNVMHWHLVDDQGWRIESKTYPALHEKASDGQYYTHAQIAELIEYADARGIRIVPEIDVPGHATSICVAFPEICSAPGPYQIERNAGIMDPALNPTIDETYDFLKNIFREVSGLFPDEYFHVGGDENNGVQWDANKDIQAFMKANEIKDNHELLAYFSKRLSPIVVGLGKKMMGWDEILLPGLPKESVIHSWFGKESLYRAAKAGYQTVLSNGYYIDLVKPTVPHYLNDPLSDAKDMTEDQIANILGGEATMWAELVTPLTIDSRIWPRTAAIAERLWSPASVNDVDDMYRRLEEIDYRLEELGLEHNTAREVIMRNLCRGKDIGPLKTLVDVIEPMKIYTRNLGGKMNQSYTPFTLTADAARPDAPVARKFNKLVDQFMAGDESGCIEQIRVHLDMWRNNHAQLEPIIRRSPALLQIEELSANLSAIAAAGYQALEGNAKYDAQLFKAAREQGGRTELQVVDAIERLVKGK